MRYQYIVRFDGYQEGGEVSDQVLTVVADSLVEVCWLVESLCHPPYVESLPVFASVDLKSVVRSPGGAIIGPVSEVKH